MKKYIESLALGIIAFIICLMLIPFIFFIFVLCGFIILIAGFVALWYGIIGKFDNLKEKKWEI